MPDAQFAKTIFKVVSNSEWMKAELDGEFRGASIDLQDGYIHFSTADQVEETLKRHFAGQADLILVSVDSDSLTDLRWEPSRNGELFPHLYGNLELSSVISTWELPIGKNGDHLLPPDLHPDQE